MSGHRRLALVTTVSLIAMFGHGVMQPALGQPIERPTTCAEEMIVGNVFIGHNCGEFASVLISGRLVIERPWSRVNRASRAERLRSGRRTVAPRVEAEATETPTVTVTETTVGTSSDTATDRAAERETRRASRDRGTGGEDVDCGDFTYQDDAQEYFDEQGFSATNDPYGLDDRGVGDGVACESLPARRR